MKITIACAAIVLLIGGVAAASDKNLTFNAKGKFKLIQLTDIHLGEADENDVKSQALISKLIDLEDPDVVIVTGDVVSGYAWDGKTKPWAAIQYAKMADAITAKGKYWATTAGNHDEEGDLTREQISEVDRSFSNSLTKPN